MNLGNSADVDHDSDEVSTNLDYFSKVVADNLNHKLGDIMADILELDVDIVLKKTKIRIDHAPDQLRDLVEPLLPGVEQSHQVTGQEPVDVVFGSATLDLVLVQENIKLLDDQLVDFVHQTLNCIARKMKKNGNVFLEVFFVHYNTGNQTLTEIGCY